MTELIVQNRQRFRKIRTTVLKQMADALVTELFRERNHQIGVYLVSERQMTSLNETYLGHPGSTDVITFNYEAPSSCAGLQGEIFICVQEAVVQAREHKTTWQSEVARYLVHGLLHLNGYDDIQPEKRKIMKRREQRCLDRLANRFPPGTLGEP